MQIPLNTPRRLVRLYRAFAIAAACTLALAVGCSRSEPPAGRLSPEAAAELQSSRSAFDSTTPPPIAPDTYLAAGRLAESRGDLGTAVQQYRKALDARPNHAETLFRLASVLSRTSSPDAPAAWRSYIAATDGSATGWANLGFSYELLGDVDAAMQAYQQGISVNPEDPACRINYGLLLARQGRLQDAESQLLLALPPEQAWYNIGSALEQQGDVAGAAAAYRRALAIQPDFEPARIRLDALAAPDPADDQ